eukprot:CAMPEP_0197630378 /NCGR_PEP_ID=MMETSP1338-20131121/7885_1 /TAXON_ID=43686 ORGANISM="Pelagodinium beii, Strain RCC1491" /NCGR_SAMPLE_ID=MMETSP1338 /ASSEMBLY_ACC=CAM_ASM_000754 /LENGTH=511 /DNA_ID=CAMNT_0043201589 /DNA_START=52 /DNA_END=1587 /DNA_ORIENTATION=+
MAGKLPAIIGEAANVPEVEEKPPIDFDSIEGERFLADKHSVKLTYGSDTNLKALKLDGKPARLFWDVTKKIGAPVAAAEHGFATFKLTTPGFSQLEDKLKKKHLDASISDSQASPTAGADGGLMATSTSLGASILSSASLKSGIGADGKPLKRAERYFQLLMKAHNKREEEDRKEAYDEEWRRCQGAAKLAFEKILAAENIVDNPPPEAKESSDEEENDSDDESEGPEDFGDLTEYDGQMKIEIDFIVLKAPGEEEVEEDFEEEHESSEEENGEDESEESTPPIDWSEELEALKAEMKAAEPPKEGEDGDENEMPEGLRGVKKMPNMWDNPFPEWTLDMGGSVFFVPAAERYAFAPSLPPPPPPSIHGRRRIHLKPRLPLDISNHRYKDEHPNIWPANGFSPELQHYQSFEKKMMTFDLYRATSEALARLPQASTSRESAKQKWQFGKYVEHHLGRSRAWKNWRDREREKRAAEEAQRQAEHQAAMERQKEQEEKLKELEAKMAAGELEDD